MKVARKHRETLKTGAELGCGRAMTRLSLNTAMPQTRYCNSLGRMLSCGMTERCLAG